jgi:NAD(P)-dependent dehydrogenase (short-subunit alcohol dehydrogenase family)
MSQPAVILVTGASRGLGRGIAVELARRGHSVAVNYVRNSDAADVTLRLCEDARVSELQRFVSVRADISVSVDREHLVATVVEDFGRLDCLVNNAGIGPIERADLLETEEASFDAVMDTNLKGPYFLTQEVARYWLEEKPAPLLGVGFCVIFVTSISAHTASVNRGEYCISKAGLSMASMLWSARLAGEGIPVYEVRPGIMESDMTAGVRDKYDKLIAEGVVPAGRWGTGEDVGRAVAALVDGEFAYSTGAVIDVDGGFHLRRL